MFHLFDNETSRNYLVQYQILQIPETSNSAHFNYVK